MLLYHIDIFLSFFVLNNYASNFYVSLLVSEIAGSSGYRFLLKQIYM